MRVAHLPERCIPVVFHGDRYYVSHGVWFRDAGRGYVVTPAPLGALVPVLPPGASTMVFHGIAYYVSRDTYYASAVGAPGYVVVLPPDDAEPTPVATPPGAGIEIEASPLQHQDEAMGFNDRADCSREATAISGFDPTRPVAPTALA